MVVRRLAGIVLVAFFGIIAVSFSMHDVDAQQADTETFDYAELIVPDLRRIAWRPDGQVLAVAAGNEVILYTSALQEILRLEGHTDIANSVSWSADGTRLASGGNDDVALICPQ
jgi:WD40 repeat protein